MKMLRRRRARARRRDSESADDRTKNVLKMDKLRAKGLVSERKQSPLVAGNNGKHVRYRRGGRRRAAYEARGRVFESPRAYHLT
jgi:hypothetical protein